MIVAARTRSLWHRYAHALCRPFSEGVLTLDTDLICSGRHRREVAAQSTGGYHKRRCGEARRNGKRVRVDELVINLDLIAGCQREEASTTAASVYEDSNHGKSVRALRDVQDKD